MNPHGTTIKYDDRGNVVEVTLHYTTLVERNGRSRVESVERTQRMNGDRGEVEEVVNMARLVLEDHADIRHALDNVLKEDAGSSIPRQR